MSMSTSRPPTSVENPQTDLLNALSALYVGGKYSDLTICCNYRQWAVHRAVVCSRSAFFDGACGNQFREANSGIIDLSEDDEEAVEQMVHFFYHLDYLNETQPTSTGVFRHRLQSDSRRHLPKRLDLTHIEDPLMALAQRHVVKDPLTPPVSSPVDESSVDGFDVKPKSPIAVPLTPPADEEWDYNSDAVADEEEEPLDDSQMVLHTRVYALAEKYDIPSLKYLAKSKFEMAMACFYDSPDFALAIEEVYCSTIDSDRGLRDIVLEAFKNYPQLASTQDVFAVINETPSLALDLFKLERGIPIG